MAGQLARCESSVAWELRGHWIRRRPVLVVLSDRCEVERVYGRVAYVAVTGAYAVIDGWHVPCVEILGVNVPTVAERDKLEAEKACPKH